MTRPGIVPLDDQLLAVRVAERDGAVEVGRTPLVGHVVELGEQQLVVAGVAPWAGPDQRAESTPGIPLSASTQSPLSSASDGSPVASTPARALSSALPSNVGWSSTGSS